MAKNMTSAQSLLGLVSQLQNMESSFTAILMEAAMKLAGLTDANVFLLVESQDGRRFSGKRYLCDAYLNGALLPIGNDAEFEVNPAISALQLRRQQGGGGGVGNQQHHHQQLLPQQQHSSTRMFGSPTAQGGGRDFNNTPSPFSSPSNHNHHRQAFSPQSPNAMRKRQFPRPVVTSSSTGGGSNQAIASSSPLSKYPRVSPTEHGGSAEASSAGDGKGASESPALLTPVDTTPAQGYFEVACKLGMRAPLHWISDFFRRNIFVNLITPLSPPLSSDMRPL